MQKGLKRILILSIWESIWSLGEGGGVPDELYFIRKLTGEGIDMHLLIPESADGAKTLEIPGLTCHSYPNIFRTLRSLPLPLQRMLITSLFPVIVKRHLEELAADIGPDIILGLTHYTLKPVGETARSLGVPSAVKLCGVMYLGRPEVGRLKYWWFNFDQLRALRHPVDLYIVLNDGTLGDRALRRLGIPPERISFLPNGMDKTWADMPVDRAEARVELGLPTDRILIVTVSRLVKSKRVHLLIDAVSKIDQGLLEKTALVIGGDGRQMKKLRRRAADLGLGERVIFTGMIPYERIVRFLKAGDIFAATNELTNMSLPPCEAVLCGLPVVAFDVAGTREVIRDGETGLLAADGDTADLTRKLEMLIADEELRSIIGERGREFGRTEFVSWEDRVAMELDLLRGLIDG